MIIRLAGNQNITLNKKRAVKSSVNFQPITTDGSSGWGLIQFLIHFSSKIAKGSPLKRPQGKRLKKPHSVVYGISSRKKTRIMLNNTDAENNLNTLILYLHFFS